MFRVQIDVGLGFDSFGSGSVWHGFSEKTPIYFSNEETIYLILMSGYKFIFCIKNIIDNKI